MVLKKSETPSTRNVCLVIVFLVLFSVSFFAFNVVFFNVVKLKPELTTKVESNIFKSMVDNENLNKNQSGFFKGNLISILNCENIFKKIDFAN